MDKQIKEMIELLNNKINVQRNLHYGKSFITIPIKEADKILDILKGYRKQVEAEWMKYYFRHEYDKWEAEIKQEVAKQIFEDFTKHKVCTNEEDYRVLAELKKKYIGE